MNKLQKIIKNLYKNPEHHILKIKNGNEIICESVIECEYVYSGGRWNDFAEYDNHEQKIKNYLTALFKKIYNESNITTNIEVECSRGSLRNKIRIKISSWFDLQMEDISMINQLLLLVAVFIGINSTVYLVQHNSLKKIELQHQNNEKQREHEKEMFKIQQEHEKELAAIKVLGKEYILDQIQKGNITVDYGDKLEETMNSSFVPDQMEDNEKIELRKISIPTKKITATQAVIKIIKNDMSVEDYVLSHIKNEQKREDVRKLLYSKMEQMADSDLSTYGITIDEWNNYWDKFRSPKYDPQLHEQNFPDNDPEEGQSAGMPM